MQEYEPEAVEAFRKLYSEKKDTIDYLEKFGNKFEKAQAMLIKEVAGYGSKGCSNVVETQQPLETSSVQTNHKKELCDCYDKI